MGFLKKLFKKKKGGTKLGNLIRGVANKVSGGKLGTGKNMLPVDEVPNDSLSQATGALVKNGQFQEGSKVGAHLVDLASTMINDGLQKEKGSGSAVDGAMGIVDNVMQNTAQKYTMSSVKDFVKKYWIWAVLPIGVVLVWKLGKYLFSKVKPKKRAY